MNYYKLLGILELSATILVESGAEISRVSQTIYSISQSYGVSNTGVFITPTGLLISFEVDEIIYSRIKSVQGDGFDMERINQVNHLSRKSEQMSLDDLYDELTEVAKMKDYSRMIKCLAGGGMALFFTLFFGGTIITAAWAFAIGCCTQYLKMNLEMKKVNAMIKTILLVSFFTLTSVVLLQLNLIPSEDSVITGCLMLVVPGLSLVSSIRDSIAGDMLSGLVRGFEAFLITAAMVIGTSLILLTWFELLKRGLIQ